MSVTEGEVKMSWAPVTGGPILTQRIREAPSEDGSLFTLRMKGNKTKPGEGKGRGDGIFQEEYTASTHGQD